MRPVVLIMKTLSRTSQGSHHFLPSRDFAKQMFIYPLNASQTSEVSATLQPSTVFIRIGIHTHLPHITPPK